MKLPLFAMITVLGSAVPAAAQTPIATRGFVVVNGGYQLTANDFDDGDTFPANGEEAQFTADYEVKGGPAFDVSGGAVVWRRLGIGAGVTRFSRSTPSVFKGSVPHPFFFSRPRAVGADVAGLKREELAVHVQARLIAPVGNRLQFMVFGGPSFFQVKQGMVSEFTWSESYPYDDATLKSTQTTNSKGSKIGFNAGADVGFFFARQVGVGGTVQFASASVDLPGAGGNTQSIKVGGAKAGGGLRLRF